VSTTCVKKTLLKQQAINLTQLTLDTQGVKTPQTKKTCVNYLCVRGEEKNGMNPFLYFKVVSVVSVLFLSSKNSLLNLTQVLTQGRF
jgi:hypothetical protein